MSDLDSTSFRSIRKTLVVFVSIFGILTLVSWLVMSGSLGSTSLASASAASTSTNQSQQLQTKLSRSLYPYFALTSPQADVGQRALATIKKDWHPGSATMLVEVSRFCRNRQTVIDLFRLADSQTGNSFKSDTGRWRNWIWSQKYDPHPDYAEFKKHLYGKIDPRFEEYYETLGEPTIRLDEIRWGGVVRDGIPPLKNPMMITAEEATYLEDTNVVFGITINGDSRCYPKRVLAWHEMFKDTIGGQSVAGVY